MKQPNLLTEIVSSAKKRGYITQEEILSLYPHPENHLLELDKLYDKLIRSDIDVFESVASEKLSSLLGFHSLRPNQSISQ